MMGKLYPADELVEFYNSLNEDERRAYRLIRDDESFENFKAMTTQERTVLLAENITEIEALEAHQQFIVSELHRYWAMPMNEWPPDLYELVMSQTTKSASRGLVADIIEDWLRAKHKA
jgi:hypothetical protein